MPRVSADISYLSTQQVARLLAVVNTIRDRALFTVAYWRGLRASEVGLMQYSDWKPDSGRLYVRRLKGSNSGEYKVSPDELSAIRAWVKVRGEDPGPMFPSRQSLHISRQRLHTIMKSYCRLAGIGPPIDHFHVLRHSIAVHLAEKGIDVAVIQDWLGHRDISSTMVYVRITNKARDHASDTMYGEAVNALSTPPALPPASRVKVNWSRNRTGAGRKA